MKSSIDKKIKKYLENYKKRKKLFNPTSFEESSRVLILECKKEIIEYRKQIEKLSKLNKTKIKKIKKLDIRLKNVFEL